MTRTAAVAPAENSTFEGPEPGRIVVQDTLMQDMVLGAELVVSESSEYPVATFENFLAEGGNAQREGRAHEALVVVDPKDSDRRLLHVRPDATSATGWVADPVLDSYKPNDVFVLSYSDTDSEGRGLRSIWCVIICDDGIFGSRLDDDGRTWRNAKNLYKGQVRAIQGPICEYHSGPEDFGGTHGLYSRLVVHAATGPSAGKLLEVTADPPQRSLLAELGSSSEFDRAEFAAAYLGALCWKEGRLSAWVGDEEVEVSPPSDFSSLVGGFCANNSGQGSDDMFLVETELDSGIRMWRLDFGEEIVQCSLVDEGEVPFPKGMGIGQVKVNLHWNPRARYGHPEELALINLYGLDGAGTVWLVRQNPNGPWNGRCPAWLPAVPVDRDVAKGCPVTAGHG
ncbi:hypothetical protein ABZ202_28515 [Streptomyces sp. NPDC006186]|uniref:hypothetical protein n=1 Tax=Streptomyces sp. NPDC006186 TaxID=3155248 RepID=UPI0033ABDCB9